MKSLQADRIVSETPEHLFFVLPNAAVPSDASAATMGSKAYGLLRLARLGLPVPPAFVLGTALCRDYFASRRRFEEEILALLVTGLTHLEAATGQQFGGTRRPLLVSVRSGAPVSMPGMMETILNVGLCERNLHGLLRETGNPRQARDCYQRLVRDFMEVVHCAAAAPFDAIVTQQCSKQGLSGPRELDSGSLSQIIDDSLEAALALTGRPFPQAPMDQLVQAVGAVFRSWDSEKARHYRRINGIDDAMGTAVTVQAMVFGNSGATSGAGVGFTRNPATGENSAYFDFLFNAQGEDVVSGRHSVNDTARLPRQLPLVAAELQRVTAALETEFRDMQDFEFTVENGRLYILQTRAAMRTPWAAVRIATDMVREGRITPTEALSHVEGLQLDRIGRTRLAAQTNSPALATAVSASTGVAGGSIVFESKRAVELAAQGRRVILARPDIQTSDIEGIAAADGVLTTAGGRTSHAAVVARQLGKVCLVACSELHIAPDGKSCVLGVTRFSEGDEVTLESDAGRIYAGRLQLVHERPEKELAELAAWRAAAL
jgi:pyruvate,orthophosphate dikinase